MGVLWTVLATVDSETKEWVDSFGVEFDCENSRYPTGSEIITALESLSNNYDISITDNGIGYNWQAFICSKKGADHGPWTLLNITKFQGLEKENEFHFEKGFPELIEIILKKLTPICGTLALVPDTGDDPVIIK